jgi:hypothetical protein
VYFLSASSAACLAWASWVSITAILSSSILALLSRTLRILNERAHSWGTRAEQKFV